MKKQKTYKADIDGLAGIIEDNAKIEFKNHSKILCLKKKDKKVFIRGFAAGFMFLATKQIKKFKPTKKKSKSGNGSGIKVM